MIRQIERNIFFHILEISDINFQKKIWFNYYPNYISSYRELMCSLFDDDNFLLFLDQYTTLLNYDEQFKNKLYSLYKKLISFNSKDDLTDKQIIENKHWVIISKYAKTIIKKWPNLAELLNNIN